jgi:hypothetical protein
LATIVLAVFGCEGRISVVKRRELDEPGEDWTMKMGIAFSSIAELLRRLMALRPGSYSVGTIKEGRKP